MRAVVVALLPDFEKQTGHKVTFDNATAGTLKKRIEGGEAFDVAIITPAVVDDLAGMGKIVAGSRIDLAKVGMGVAIKEGAAVPDIKTVDAFKRMLLAAKSVAYIDPKAGGSSGIYFDKLLDRLGIGDQIRAEGQAQAGRLRRRAGGERRGRGRHPPDQRDRAGQGRSPGRTAAGGSAEFHDLFGRPRRRRQGRSGRQGPDPIHRRACFRPDPEDEGHGQALRLASAPGLSHCAIHHAKRHLRETYPRHRPRPHIARVACSDETLLFDK